MQVIDWQVVVKKHGPLIWQTAYRLLGNHADTADCFQETFVSALEVSRRQRVRNFSALLVQLATARAVDRLLKRMRQSHASGDLANLTTVPSDNIGPFQQVQAQKLVTRLRLMLSQLSPQEARSRRTERSEEKYDAGKVENLKTNLIKALKHAANIRSLKPDDSLILTGTGSGDFSNINITGDYNCWKRSSYRSRQR